MHILTISTEMILHFFALIAVAIACVEVEDCPIPEDLCLMRDCWAGECMDVESIICDDFDSCTNDSCLNGTCINTLIQGCCHASEDCQSPLNVCEQSICTDYNETVGYGFCDVVTLLYPCCESDEECVSPDNPCRFSACNLTSHVCDVVNEYEMNCSEIDTDDTRCTFGACINGSCELVTIPDEECPGACCLGYTCDDTVDQLWCTMMHGQFLGHDANCSTCEPPPCERDCDCAEFIFPPDLCRIDTCRDGVCVMDRKLNCPHECA